MFSLVWVLAIVSDCSTTASSREMLTDLGESCWPLGLPVSSNPGRRGGDGKSGRTTLKGAGRASASDISTSGSLTRFRETSSASQSIMLSSADDPVPPLPPPSARPRNLCATRVRGLAFPSSAAALISKVNCVAVLILSVPSSSISLRFLLGVVNGDSVMMAANCRCGTVNCSVGSALSIRFAEASLSVRSTDGRFEMGRSGSETVI